MKTKVYWCQCGPRQGNFGDKLTSLLLDYFAVPHAWSPPDCANLFGIGSILEAVPENFSGAIWTSGAISSSPQPRRFEAASVIAVRGKLTLGQIEVPPNSEIVLGDGGLLVSLLRRATPKRYKIGLIPHYAQADDPEVRALAEHPEIHLIDACASPREVIHHISQCESVLSSSLHGLIVSDALGIPNRWVQFPATSSRVIGGSFKFLDYYSAFGIEDLQPTWLTAHETLDTLLPLFERYSRPGIDGRIDGLLDVFDNVFEKRSRSDWQAKRQNIRERERQVFHRLNMDLPDSEEGCLWAAPGKSDESSAEPDEPLAAAKIRIRGDASKLAELFGGCLEILRRIHARGVCHGDIREPNLRVRGSTPGLVHFGWRAIRNLPPPSAKTLRLDRSAEWSEWAAMDIRAMGKVLNEFCEDEPSLRTVAQLMMHPDESIAIHDLELLRCCVDAIASRFHSSPEPIVDAGGPIDASPAQATANAIGELLSRLARQERQIQSLQRQSEFAEARLREVEYDLIAAELSEHVPPPNRFLIADGEQWRAELRCVERAIPFPEKDGLYWGLPSNDAHAVGELERLRSLGIDYFVLAEPMDWWRDAYPGFFHHLDARFKRCHESNRMTVFRVA